MRDFKEIASEGEMHSGEIGHVMFTYVSSFHQCGKMAGLFKIWPFVAM